MAEEELRAVWFVGVVWRWGARLPRNSCKGKRKDRCLLLDRKMEGA